MAGRLTKVGKAFYLFTMPGHLFPDSSVLTNSAWSYLRRADFLMDVPSLLPPQTQVTRLEHSAPGLGGPTVLRHTRHRPRERCCPLHELTLTLPGPSTENLLYHSTSLRLRCTTAAASVIMRVHSPTSDIDQFPHRYVRSAALGLATRPVYQGMCQGCAQSSGGRDEVAVHIDGGKVHEREVGEGGTGSNGDPACV